MSSRLKKEIEFTCDYPECKTLASLTEVEGWSSIHVQIGESGRFSKDLDLCPAHTSGEILDTIFQRVSQKGKEA